MEMEAHLTRDDAPSEYFNGILDVPLMEEHPFLMLKMLDKTEQSPKYHPEGNVWNHTMLVVDAAAAVKRRSKDERAFMWAALLHDIGKPGTTKRRRGKITSYDHDKRGAEMAEAFLREFTDDEDFVRRVSSLVRYHMQILFVVKDLPFADIEEMKRRSDVREVALLGLCDRLGRLYADREREEENVRLFLRKVQGDKAASAAFDPV